MTIAIWCILASCIFDALDGRLARLGGHESPFGREFDSLADIVSFGVAPALMVYRIVLHEFPNVGWVIASVYLICGALRLARFNCLAAEDAASANKEFRGRFSRPLESRFQRLIIGRRRLSSQTVSNVTP